MNRSIDRNVGGRGVGPRLQRGQALAELAILAVLLVPLFLLIPMLGKYAHTRQVAQQAARAAVWEATVVDGYDWNGTLKNTAWRNKQRQLLIDRHFAMGDTRIASQAAQAQDTAAVDAPMMGTFSGKPLLTRGDFVLAPYTNGSAGAISKLLEGPGSLLEKLPGEFPPNKHGLVTAKVEVRPRNLETRQGTAATFLKPFDAIDLVMTSEQALLADTWGASGNGHLDAGSAFRNNRRVRDQVRTLVPSAYLGDSIGEVLEKLEPMEKVPLIGVPFRIRPGYIEPDIVPRDRLKPYRP
ncbi:TadE/TadG family type IV pilus assembly protein [Marilutibacter spongiae]|uniref:Pilus assembly protein n=1 Tax=Marilutibacter spongiae TaxID=2025720 RepID=A0A7W3TP96_9GAMM|nr:TadE/TadG family type IV pilus assembly protein [Lysobacter spongiae]MBB1061988.1 pilus assembly protein [Lysobacter spongiae]